MKNYFNPKEWLPKENKYVLILTNRGTWKDKDDPINVYFKVVKYSRRHPNHWGKAIRIDPTTMEIVPEIKNDLENKWEEFGTDSFRDEDILAWWPLPKLDESLKDIIRESNKPPVYPDSYHEAVRDFAKELNQSFFGTKNEKRN